MQNHGNRAGLERGQSRAGRRGAECEADSGGGEGRAKGGSCDIGFGGERADFARSMGRGASGGPRQSRSAGKPRRLGESNRRYGEAGGGFSPAWAAEFDQYHRGKCASDSGRLVSGARDGDGGRGCAVRRRKSWRQAADYRAALDRAASGLLLSETFGEARISG